MSDQSSEEAALQELYRFPLFDGVPEPEARWVWEHGRVEQVADGAYFHREGEPVDRFYIVLSGELQVTRRIGGVVSVLGTTPPGIMNGELALLSGAVSTNSARAIEPSRLLVLDAHAFRELFSACPALGARVFETAAERMHGMANHEQQREKLAALGKLSAGLAHELNNPASAVQRAAKSLGEALPELQKATARLGALGLDENQMEFVLSLQQACLPSGAAVKLLLPMEQSDREDEIAGFLEALDLRDAWEMAANFVNAGLSINDLDELAGVVPRAQQPVVLAWLDSALYATTLLDEIQQSGGQISELVGAVKSYTYMDQAPVQEVDIHKGLENTLTVMRYKLRNVEVNRKYDPELPRIWGRGGELNQVWTNLIDNAVDAMEGSGRLWLITRCENDFVMVEVADEGPGIPPEVQAHLFEPFFTTKGAGFGTGLGLDISHRIIQQHRGTIEARSEGGLTRFIVRLPVRPPDGVQD